MLSFKFGTLQVKKDSELLLKPITKVLRELYSPMIAPADSPSKM